MWPAPCGVASASIENRRTRAWTSRAGRQKWGGPGSLGNRRNRQRELALQAPRLSTTPTCPVSKQAPPALRDARLVMVAPLCAGPSCSLPGQTCPNAGNGFRLDTDPGVPIQCRLTSEIEAAFATFDEPQNAPLMVGTDPFLFSRR
jgi:hypothetical protein